MWSPGSCHQEGEGRVLSLTFIYCGLQQVTGGAQPYEGLPEAWNLQSDYKAPPGKWKTDPSKGSHCCPHPFPQILKRARGSLHQLGCHDPLDWASLFYKIKLLKLSVIYGAAYINQKWSWKKIWGNILFSWRGRPMIQCACFACRKFQVQPYHLQGLPSFYQDLPSFFYEILENICVWFNIHWLLIWFSWKSRWI